MEYGIIYLPKERKVNKWRKPALSLYRKTVEGRHFHRASNVKNSKPKEGLSLKLSYKDAADIMFLIGSQPKEKEATNNASNWQTRTELTTTVGDLAIGEAFTDNDGDNNIKVGIG